MKNIDSRLVVIIDDDDDLCQMLKAILSGSFSNVKYAHTLESGKKLLSETQPDLVFLDNNLPDGQGISLIQNIKTNFPATIVILITAMDNSRDEAIKSGADIFLEKPLTYTSIFDALKNTSTQPDQENVA